MEKVPQHIQSWTCTVEHSSQALHGSYMHFRVVSSYILFLLRVSQVILRLISADVFELHMFISSEFMGLKIHNVVDIFTHLPSQLQMTNL